MSPDMLLPIVTTLGWLILCIAAVASYRLKWSQVVKLALIWLAIFLGLFLVVEWFTVAREATSTSLDLT
ncbi:MAG: hypothetical protein GW858_03505 [Sphingomonadales bacterium]|nr:hypothetical protein [Sphingomonadales bacterium]NCQ20916.1 hypothetical protein [Sphingomonadales bacterium]NCT02673.1 hypothetical protein [Sphingomonadales bacterium]